jgi:CRP-like cAMP-binding protein
LKHFAFCRQTISAEGTVCDALFYILEGKVKLTVLSTDGKEATIAALNEGDFFREAYLAGQALEWGLQPRKQTVKSCKSKLRR